MGRHGLYREEEFVADYYDYLPQVEGRADAEFFVSLARQAEGPVLELGCGTGRVLAPIAAAGCRITGLDLSDYMLERCRQKLAAQPAEVRERVRLVRGNMIEFDLRETFKLVLLPFRPFQHLLSVEEQLACLHAAHRHLARQGKIVLDLFHTDPRRTFDPAFLEERQNFPEVPLPDGRRLRVTERIAAFHRAQQQNDVELIYYVTHPDGRSQRLVNAFTIRYFFRYEVEHLLARSGFRVLELFGNYDRSPLSDDSPEMIVVGERV